MTEANGSEADTFIGPPPQEILYTDSLSPPTEADLSVPPSIPTAETTTWETAAAQPEASEAQLSGAPFVDEGTNQDSHVVASQPEAKPGRGKLPPHVLETASKAVDALLATSARRDVTVGRIAHIAFGEALLPRREFRDFVRAVNRDPRLAYRGKGRYLIKESKSDAASGSQDGEVRPQGDSQRIARLADYAALTMLRDQVGPEGLKSRKVLGIIAANGDRLWGSEVQEFYARVAAHPNIMPLEDGNYAPKPDTPFTPQTEGFLESSYAREPGTDGQPMTPRQVLNKVRDMHHSPDFKRAQKAAERLARPKRRKSRPKSGAARFSGSASKKAHQGRGQGKKVSIETILTSID